MSVRAKRVYVPVTATDGRRYLVDRLWPRGFRKEDLAMTEWIKDVAPSRELCDWYGHEPKRFPEFRRRYRAELDANPAPIERLLVEARAGPVTLLFAARDVVRCNAEVLREFLEERLPPPAGAPRRSF